MVFDNLVAPFDKRYCQYFFFLTWIFALLGVAVVAMFVYKMAMPPSGAKRGEIFLYHFSLLINVLLAYFVNRLFYSMCIGSLRK
jgi:hypothetical protein